MGRRPAMMIAEAAASAAHSLAHMPEREFLGVLLDNLSDAIVACDATANLVLFNRAAQQLHGLPPEPGPAAGWAQHYSLFEADGKTPLTTERIPLFRAYRGETVQGQVMVIAPVGQPPRTMRVNAQRITSPTGEMLGAVAAMHDVTEQKAYEAELFQAKELAQITLAAIADGVIRTDREGCIEFCNSAALALLQTRDIDLIGRPFDAVVSIVEPASQTPLATPVKSVLQGGVPRMSGLFHQIRAGAGPERRMAYAIAPLRAIGGESIGCVVVLQDMSAAHELNQKLVRQARTDTLTGLPNRYDFEEHLAGWLQRPSAVRAGLYLFYLDLDHFKIVNDTLGHLAGDQLLQELTAHLRLALGPQDYLARIGGDEFSILMRAQQPEQADELAAKLIRIVAAYRFKVAEQQFEVGLSIGIVAVDEQKPLADELLAKADTACYVAKDMGRGRYCRYSERDSFIRGYNRKNVIAQTMQRAFESEGFQLYLERIVDGSGEARGYEALVRMRGSGHEMLSPVEFLPVAQRMGWGSRLDRWVIEHGVALLGAAVSALPPAQFLSVNLSARSLDDAEFVCWLLRYLREQPGAVTQRLHVEITETEYLSPVAGDSSVIVALQALGVEVWLDDFGAGYNSFELLKRVKVDGVKIDRSFVNDLANDPIDAAMIRAIADLSRQLGFQVIAEGVEDHSTVEQLQALGVESFQGWLFHRACPVGEALG